MGPLVPGGRNEGFPAKDLQRQRPQGGEVVSSEKVEGREVEEDNGKRR